MRQGLAPLALLFAATAGPAGACSIVVPQGYDGSAEQKKAVRDRIEKATAIVDGEVVRAWTRTTPALVKVHHVLKGNPGEFIAIGGEGAGADCSIGLEHAGERSRMILMGGPERYDLYYDQSEARLEDRILKSDRRKVWPYVAGPAADGK